MSRLKSVARAPGKVILLGEHFVVYGGSALAVALTRGVEATAVSSQQNSISSLDRDETTPLDQASGFLSPSAACVKHFLDERHLNGVSVSIKSDLPAGGGLGSSAATSVAVLAAVAALFDVRLSPSQLYDYAMVGERLVHGKPSGIDVFVSVNGGLVRVKGDRREVLQCPSFEIMVADSGDTRNTGDMVQKVSEYRKQNHDSFDTMMKATDALVQDVSQALQRGQVSLLAEAMNFNQEALRLIGASTDRLNTMVKEARSCGFAGAKLTGAGGGGCIIAVAPSDAKQPFEAFSASHTSSFLCSVPGEGVKTWVF